MFDFRFADQAALHLLWLVPVMIFFVWWTNQRTKALIRSKIAPNLTAFLLRSLSPSRRKLKLVLQCFAIFFFIIALARPQSGAGKQKAKSEGLEIMLVVDVSNSMLAQDTPPSRLELAKHELDRFIDNLGGDKVGLVAFAGSAILLSPLTDDKGAIKMYIDGLRPDAVMTQGTNFSNALDDAFHALQRGGVESDAEHHVTRVIIMASDGEDHEPGALATAKKIADAGVRIFTLGLGTAQGGEIPLRDDQGNLVGYKKDRHGKNVITKSTGESLKQIAEAGKGIYQQVTFGGDTVHILLSALDQLQKAEFNTMEITQYNEHYQIFLGLGLLLALIELALGERRGEGRLWRGRFEVPSK